MRTTEEKNRFTRIAHNARAYPAATANRQMPCSQPGTSSLKWKRPRSSPATIQCMNRTSEKTLNASGGFLPPGRMRSVSNAGAISSARRTSNVTTSSPSVLAVSCISLITSTVAGTVSAAEPKNDGNEGIYRACPLTTTRPREGDLICQHREPALADANDEAVRERIRAELDGTADMRTVRR